MKQGESTMVGYRYTKNFVRNLCCGNETMLKVTEKNVDWHLFQFGRDLSLTKAMYEQKLNEMRNLSLLPKTLQSYADKKESFGELLTYVFVLNSFLQYVQKRERPLIAELENYRTKISITEQQIREATNKEDHNVLDERRTERLKELQSAQRVLKDFVLSLFDNEIIVEENNISIYSKDSQFIQHFQNECRNTDYTLSVISRQEPKK